MGVDTEKKVSKKGKVSMDGGDYGFEKTSRPLTERDSKKVIIKLPNSETIQSKVER